MDKKARQIQPCSCLDGCAGTPLGPGQGHLDLGVGAVPVAHLDGTGVAELGQHADLPVNAVDVDHHAAGEGRDLQPELGPDGA